MKHKLRSISCVAALIPRDLSSRVVTACCGRSGTQGVNEAGDLKEWQEGANITAPRVTVGKEGDIARSQNASAKVRDAPILSRGFIICPESSEFEEGFVFDCFIYLRVSQ